MIVTVLAVIHILVCVFLILLIMIQDPKGGSNSLFGAGGSNTLLGTSGGADFMTKLTRYTAILFVGLCVALTIATRPTTSGVFSKSPLPISAPTDSPTAVPGATPESAAPATVPSATPQSPEKNPVKAAPESIKSTETLPVETK